MWSGPIRARGVSRVRPWHAHTSGTPFHCYNVISPLSPTLYPFTLTPMSNPIDDSDDPTSGPHSLPTPPKRGRKPGPLSRSARETQRKLNHSIIEKARRTKINEALATLRQLVPADYKPDKEGDESDDGPDLAQDKKLKAKKPQGKKEEKEREFKLEILVRSVSFMQELLERVKSLEDETRSMGTKCPTCLPAKRKRDEPDVDHDTEILETRSVKRAYVDIIDIQPQSIDTALSEIGTRLPSISSWLPDSRSDPTLLSPKRHRIGSISHLPSPPSSARFGPIHTPQVPPTLSLGPMAMSSLLSPPRTAEDESAASSLLKFSASSSPLLLPASLALPAIAKSTSYDMSRMRTSCITPVFPNSGRLTGHLSQAQTPRSMLGLKGSW